MPSVGPAHGIFELPYVVIEARGLLRGTQVSKVRVEEFQIQQSINTRRVAIPDSKGIAELSDARGPATTTVERDMAPAEAGIIHKITCNRSSPITNGIVNWRSAVRV